MDDDRGFCRTRVVKGGAMYTVGYGNLCALALDPIEKKPLYHFLPRSRIVSIAIGGCNLRCPNCQNWEISQATPESVQRFEVMPDQLVRTARERGAPSIAYTYTEPLIYYEYVRDSAALAREAGIKNVLVTAGYTNERPMRELCASIDAVQLDVKAFDEKTYQRVNGARLAPVLRNLEIIRQEGVWLEVSFLMVTNMTDEPKAVEDFARWVVSHLGPDTPLHLLRYHPAHRTTHLPPTPVSLLQQAQHRARSAGLRYVYIGNVPGLGAGTTVCPHDGEALIERRGYHVVRDRLTHGACPKCGERIAGVFEG